MPSPRKTDYPTLREILHLPAFAGCIVCGGEVGLERKVTGVNLTDTPGYARWLARGELLITTGFALSVAENSGRACVADDPADILWLLEADTAKAEAYIDRHLSPVLRQSEPNRQELPDTLEGWLRCLGNQRRMARELHLHYNTVSYRLRQLWSLLEAYPEAEIVRLTVTKIRNTRAETAADQVIGWFSLLLDGLPLFGTQEFGKTLGSLDQQYYLLTDAGRPYFVLLTDEHMILRALSRPIHEKKFTIVDRDFQTVGLVK